MWRVFFVNFGYFSENSGKTPDEAITIAKKAGFEARIDRPDGTPYATFTPHVGWKLWTRAA